MTSSFNLGQQHGRLGWPKMGHRRDPYKLASAEADYLRGYEYGASWREEEVRHAKANMAIMARAADV